MFGTAEEVHRTWVEYLLDSGFSEMAAMMIDSELVFFYDMGMSEVPHHIIIDLPTSIYNFITDNESFAEIAEQSLMRVMSGRAPSNVTWEFRLKLLPVDEDWKKITRSLIMGSNITNQANITEKVFRRDDKQPIVYNEMKFASQSEIRIAQEFEKRGVLFFPLPLAVRKETGKTFLDHRECDFLVCDNGVWGILEVSYHPDRFEKDAEKDTWFKKSGILCVQHYSAERCYNHSSAVVDEFQEILSKHRR